MLDMHHTTICIKKFKNPKVNQILRLYLLSIILIFKICDRKSQIFKIYITIGYILYKYKSC